MTVGWTETLYAQVDIADSRVNSVLCPEAGKLSGSLVCFLWAGPVLSSGVQPLLFTSLVTPLFPLQADPPLHAYYLLKSLKALFLALRNSLLFFCLWVNSCILRTPVIAYMPVSHRCPFPGLNHISRFLLHIPSWVADNSNPKHLVRPQLNAWPWSVPSLCSHLLIPSLTLPR